jgi:hypothetical protein
VKVYIYYTNHHRKKLMAAINQERETRYGEIVREMTARGKSAREIGNFLEVPENWVARFRTRRQIPMPPGTPGRPRHNDASRLERISDRRVKEREKRREAAEAAGRAHPWSAEDVDPVGTAMVFPIPPLYHARPPNPNRRKTFDYEDTDEL